MGTKMSAREMAAATPGARDRVIDLLRVASLGTVVFGHWLMAAVTTDGDHRPAVGNLLAVEPKLQLLTWFLQVMPVFFFVGGFSHALSYRSLTRRTGAPAYALFLRARLQRLLRPTMLFVAVWGAGALAVQLAGGNGALTDVAARLVAQPLWFIGIYLAMVAFTPPLLRLHERYGWGAFAALAAAAAAVDVLRFAAGVPYVEFLNFAFVWLAVHQLGFLRADGRLRRPADLAAAGLAGAVALVAFGPYPLSMVGMPGEKISNMAPPTAALLCHGMWLIGAVELLRGPMTRAVARPRVWRTVVAANGVAMTAFLWHLTAMLGVYGAMLAAHVSLPAPASAAWWLQVPLRIAAAAAVTALLVAVFRRAEQPPASARAGMAAAARRGAAPAAALGVTLALFGVLGLSMVGFAGLLEGHSAMLVAVRVTAPVTVLMCAAGWLLVETAGRPARPV
ncbi:acyltransferase family protein [Streptomyces roseoverticillatus]|uniref:acyltransferase family protein n=1 Tax=Streptomyces roseoverticillatus TaxID=66429 RepID=UPI001F251EEF|nr:acyltransferase family protein [Streptomyces roseoverticillatus]MCF3106497.1 acyltransferase family protein [Streptomyces roseoverticillatus]